MQKKWIVSFVILWCLAMCYNLKNGWKNSGLEREAYLKRLFESDVSEIQCVSMNVYQLANRNDISPLRSPVVLRSKEDIKKFFEILKKSKKCIPSHPGFKYEVEVKITDENGDFGFSCGQTSEQGFLICTFSAITEGYFYGFYRNDELKDFILNFR